ncbi:hypothetical protein Tco_0561005, partial [Tanacetum coccineum]
MYKETPHVQEYLGHVLLYMGCFLCSSDLKYLKGKPNLGLWYPRESPFDLEAFSDSDYGGSNLDRKSTTSGCQFLIEVLKSHKRAIAWKPSDIKGINPKFCTHKILMEEDYEPTVQHQRRVNPKIHDIIKKEVEKLLDAGLIYPISDSPW